jgi:hypothetical protein
MTQQEFKGPVGQAAGRDIRNTVTVQIDARAPEKVARTLADLPTDELRALRAQLEDERRTLRIKLVWSWPALVPFALVPLAGWNVVNATRSLGSEPVSTWPIYVLIFGGIAAMMIAKASLEQRAAKVREVASRIRAIDKILRERVD